MFFDCHLLLIVHIDKQQIVAVELFRSLNKCIELTLPGFVTADIVGDLYQLLYGSIFDDHEVHFPLSVTVIEDVFVLWAVTTQQFYIYHILQSPVKICRSDDIISVSHESRIDNVDFLVQNALPALIRKLMNAQEQESFLQIAIIVVYRMIRNA